MYSSRYLTRINGRVFVDSNDNGICGEGEMSLKGIRFSLYFFSSTNTK